VAKVRDGDLVNNGMFVKEEPTMIRLRLATGEEDNTVVLFEERLIVDRMMFREMSIFD
jgi:hypothetical protein